MEQTLEHQNNETSKKERLEVMLNEMTDNMTDQLPAHIQMMASSVLPLLFSRFQQLEESDIDVFIDKARGLIDYVEHGEQPVEEHGDYPDS